VGPPSGTSGASHTASGWTDAVMQPTPSDRGWTEPAPMRGGSGVEGLVEEFGSEDSSYGLGSVASSGPTEAELQFWAQTRTALRHLQQASDGIPKQVGSVVTESFEQVVRDELAAPTASLRQLQQQLPGYAEHVARVVADELEGPAAAIRQLQDDVPAQIDRLERNMRGVMSEELPARLDALDRDLHGALREELPAQLDRLERNVQGVLRDELPQHLDRLDRNMNSAMREDLPQHLDRIERMVSGALHEQLPQRLERLERSVTGQMQEDAERFEQSVAGNVTRLAQGLEGRVVDSEQQLRAQFERVESTMRGELDRVQRGLHQDIAGHTELTRQLQEQLPGQLGHVEHTVREQAREISGEIRTDLASLMGEMATLNRATLDRLAAVSGDLDRDRLQRVEDLELLVDSMTTGWKGIYGAVTQVFDRAGEIDGRIGSLERTLEQSLAQVRQQLETNLGAMQQHLKELQPAPVVVTVNHPDAQVAQTSRPGYTTGQESTPGTSY
jgi:hypothetical protein